MRRTIFIIVFAAVVIGGVFVFMQSERGGEAQKTQKTQETQETQEAQTENGVLQTRGEFFERTDGLAFHDYGGNAIQLSDYAGVPLVVNSWAAWCPFCKKELLDFALAQKEFGGRVKIIAVDRAEPLETAKKYSDKLGVSDKLIFLLDPDDSFYRAIGGFSMPETVFVDAAGNIVFHKRGPMELPEIRDRIEQIL